MTKDLRTLTLAERLKLFPPFLCFALTRVRLPALTKEEIRQTLWTRENRRRRKLLKAKGVELPRRKCFRRKTVEEVAVNFARSERWYVPRLVRKLTWDEVQLRDALRFMDACGIDILHIKQVRYTLRNGLERGRVMDHLTEAEKRDFAKLVREWKKLSQ